VTIEERMQRDLQPLAQQLSKTKGWELGAFLGAGATAATFEVGTPKGLRALKLYSPNFLKGKRGTQVRRRFAMVVDHLTGHSCPYLISVDEGAEFKNTLYMLMHRAPGKCLAKVLKLVPPGNIRAVVRQIATAAKFLEEKGICHRDIKSDNIVITDDFSSAVLLDLGVVRWLDEEGIGTDHEGQLPFVATAQYSSPEYMFRLGRSGPDLWRGLTFYQLGGLLHDLIMKERLFEDVIQRAAENRYLIAYAVATRIPSVINDGSVPLDLVLLAQRALEKDAARRLASIEWADFLGNEENRQNEVILGLRSGQVPSQAPVTSVIPTWIRELEDALDRRLIESGIHCKHDSKVASHDHAFLEFSWTPAVNILPEQTDVVVRIEMVENNSKVILTGSSKLEINREAIERHGPTPLVTLPVQLGEQYPPTLIDQMREGFIALSARVVENYSNSVARRADT
jgi:serine/threonine protein kinase